jgi:transposase
MMEISVSTPMPGDGNCQVIEHLEARPLRARRGWSAEAKARLVEKTLVPGANVSAIARGAGMAPSQLFGWRRQARAAAIRNKAVDSDRPMRFERFAAVSRALVEIVIGEVVLRAGSDVEPDHLANVIRAVRKA